MRNNTLLPPLCAASVSATSTICSSRAPSFANYILTLLIHHHKPTKSPEPSLFRAFFFLCALLCRLALRGNHMCLERRVLLEFVPHVNLNQLIAQHKRDFLWIIGWMHFAADLLLIWNRARDLCCILFQCLVRLLVESQLGQVGRVRKPHVENVWCVHEPQITLPFVLVLVGIVNFVDETYHVAVSLLVRVEGQGIEDSVCLLHRDMFASLYKDVVLSECVLKLLDVHIGTSFEDLVHGGESGLLVFVELLHNLLPFDKEVLIERICH
mmetsp:Transcript_1814/g.6436  ORF Transcript_1814/g.6436 Transcript_1814/m.6436 type:complete len:268 (+) Transcript_1814:545-1348(+)